MQIFPQDIMYFEYINSLAKREEMLHVFFPVCGPFLFSDVVDYSICFTRILIAELSRCNIFEVHICIYFMGNRYSGVNKAICHTLLMGLYYFDLCNQIYGEYN